MNSLDSIAADFVAAGFVAHSNGSDVKVSFASTPALYWIQPEGDRYGVTLFAGIDRNTNDWAFEVELDGGFYAEGQLLALIAKDSKARNL